MNISFRVKTVIVTTVLVVVSIASFFIYALAGLGAQPVNFAAPPEFVEQYAVEKGYSVVPSLMGQTVATDEGIDSPHMATNFSKEEALVHRVIFDGESPELILQLFAHPEQTQRVKIASAFAAVNIKYTHNEESGFNEKRRQFWLDVEQNLPDIENALFEALIATAREETKTRIPYTVAWIPGNDHENAEVLAWAAQHHPDPWVRKFSVYFVVKFGQNEELSRSLLRSRTHDPDYKVRKQVLELRINKLTGKI